MRVRRYKFQAFVTVPAPGEVVLPPGKIRRMTLRGENHTTHGSHFFSALVANQGDNAEWIGDNHAIVTVSLAGEDPAEYFSAGDHFALWLGHDVAEGVVTRRLFV